MDTADTKLKEAFDDSLDSAELADDFETNPARRVQVNVENLPVTSVVLATLLGAGLVALTVLAAQALKRRSDPGVTA
jgi:hypothetical protein